jgi:hypothetical protein
MWHYVVKVLVTVAVVVAVSEIAKRSAFWGAVLASLPLISLLAFVWLYVDTHDVQRVADLSQGIFWLVLPSLTMFLLLPFLLRSGWSFWYSLAVACVATVMAYFGVIWFLQKLGIRM